MIQSKKKINKFEKIYIKHIQIKSISSQNVYEKKMIIKKIQVCVYIGILIKNGENQYLDL